MGTKRVIVRRQFKKPPRPRTTDTAELDVQRMPIGKLKAHPRNKSVRKHPRKGTAKWEALRRSLEHDYFDPLVWNKRNGMLVSGHLRTKVLREMGVKQVDVVVVDYDEQTHLARLVAANNPLGYDDPDGLTDLFESLAGMEDLAGLSTYTPEEVDSLFEEEREEEGDGSSDEEGQVYDDKELGRLAKFFKKENPSKFETKKGDVYKVGDNFLYVGSVIEDHEAYLPLLEQLKEEFPERQVLFIPVPDPVMVGTTDKRVAALFIQPSTTAADYSLTFVRVRSPKHPIKKVV
jgi:hypothetical protein